MVAVWAFTVMPLSLSTGSRSNSCLFSGHTGTTPEVRGIGGESREREGGRERGREKEREKERENKRKDRYEVQNNDKNSVFKREWLIPQAYTRNTLQWTIHQSSVGCQSQSKLSCPTTNGSETRKFRIRHDRYNAYARDGKHVLVTAMGFA